MEKLKWLALLSAPLFALCASSVGGTMEAGISPAFGVNTPGGWRSAKHRCGFDTSRHKTCLVKVAKDVELEVLDWGGVGEPLVLLSGLGNTAHVYDEFAYQFTDKFHVLGITRRGYGKSSQPADGYDIATRAEDDIKVLDHFKIGKAIFAGHSISGVELSRLGAHYPDRVAKLVYLDAYEYGPSYFEMLKHTAPPAPESTMIDKLSPQHLSAYYARVFGFRLPTTDFSNTVELNRRGNLVNNVTPADIGAKILFGSGLAEFDLITAPTLAFFARPQATPPYVWDLPEDQQEQYKTFAAAHATWQAGVMQRLSDGVKGSQVVEIPDAAHYLFITNESKVIQLMREFLLK